MRYFCTTCSEIYSLAKPRWRCGCGGMLDLTSPSVSPMDIDYARSGVWRYPSLLPPVADSARISLGEVITPLVERDLGAFLKLDYLLPTGSYKDRGATVLVSRLTDLGVKEIVLESSGNAGAALSAYCAAAGITCQVFSPAGNSCGKLAQIAAVGGQLKPVMGSQADAMRAAMAAAEDSFYASPNWSPDFVAGVATVAIELWEQLNRRAPSSILAPCGHGGRIVSLFRGFDALMRGGLIGELPRLIAVQPRVSIRSSTQLRTGEQNPRHAEPENQPWLKESPASYP